MLPAPFIVVLDTNALFPFSLRDILLRAAAGDFYQVRWSADILGEMTRNLILKGGLTEVQASRLRDVMQAAFPEAEVTGYSALIASMENDDKDRHVVAAAVKTSAQVIVTFNLSDFARLPDGIEAQSPDDFLCNLFDLDPDGILELLTQQANDLQRPPTTLIQLLDRLVKIVPNFVAAVRKRWWQLDP